MAYIQWKDRYNINFREIDAQHHGLLDLLNELSDQADGRRHPGSVTLILQALGEYAKTHFSSEERYMQAAGYPKLAQHRQEHAAFVSRLQALTRAHDPRDPYLAEATMAFLRDWYLTHITKVDQEYAPLIRRALPTATVEAVLFGLEGVLCKVDPAPFQRAVEAWSGRPEIEVQTALWEDPGLLRKLEAGTWNLERFEVEAAGWTGRAPDLAALEAAYLEGFQPVPAMLRLADLMKPHQRVVLTGNATPWMRNRGLERLELEGLFNEAQLSCDAGHRAPAKAFYRAAAERLGVDPGACFLIHRDQACLDGAQDAGLQVLDYTTPVMLMAQLRRMAIPF
jgi:hemerythrin